jgi:hypothetical protein
MALGGSGNQNNKFVVQFTADMKEFRKGIQELRASQRDAMKAAQSAIKTEQKRSKDKKKDFDEFQKKTVKAQKDERKHLHIMSREESKRHKQSMAQMLTLHKQNVKLTQQVQNGQRRTNRNGQPEKEQQPKRSVLGTAGALAGGAIMGLAGFVIASALRGYQQYIQYGQALGQNIGLSSGKNIRKGIGNAMGGKLGFSKIDTAQQSPLMARATGAIGPRELQQANRATGMEVGEVAQQFGIIRRAGYSFEGSGNKQSGTGLRSQSAGGKEFQKIFAAGLASGLERARVPEFLEAISKTTEERGGMDVGKVNMQSIAMQLAAWGRGGQAGLQGARGAALFQKMNNSFMAPGGGEWGESFMRQAQGFGRPGGSTDFYTAEKRREKGVEDPQNLMRLMGEVKAQFGSGQEGALALRELAGTSLEQSETLLKIYDSNKSVEDKQNEVKDEVAKSKPIEQQSLDAMKNIGGVVKRIATLTDRGIGVGTKAASAIEYVEDLQYKLLEKLLYAIETIRDWIKSVLVKLNLINDPDKDPEFKKKEAAQALKEARSAMNLGQFGKAIAAAGGASSAVQGAEFPAASDMSDDQIKAATINNNALIQQREEAAKLRWQSMGAAQYMKRRGLDPEITHDKTDIDTARQFGAKYADTLKKNFGSYSDITNDAAAYDMLNSLDSKSMRTVVPKTEKSTAADSYAAATNVDSTEPQRFDVVIHTPPGTMSTVAQSPAKRGPARVKTATH